VFDTLGIDWGEKRCGLAFGSVSTRLIIPYQGEVSNCNAIDIIINEILSKNITQIILGVPTNFNQSPTLVTQKIQDFKRKLISVLPSVIPIHIVNERGTTKSAKIISPQASKTDINHLAAMKIVEYYFDSTI
jgi:RNase H-fold protein (predicted Holliday junction resolvase)